MARADKLEQALRRSPGSVRVEQLVTVLERHGFDCRRTSSGHWVCLHPGRVLDVHFAEPHGGGEGFLKLPYVKKAVRALDALAAGEDERDG